MFIFNYSKFKFRNGSLHLLHLNDIISKFIRAIELQLRKIVLRNFKTIANSKVQITKFRIAHCNVTLCFLVNFNFVEKQLSNF